MSESTARVQIDKKVFVFSEPPTGLQVAEVVKEHELYGYTVDISRVTGDLSRALAVSTYTYTYEVTFSRRIK